MTETKAPKQETDARREGRHAGESAVAFLRRKDEELTAIGRPNRFLKDFLDHMPEDLKEVPPGG